MSANTQPKDIRTDAFVLRRTNYGEADRILNLITPDGKISAIAKGVRKEKSKLAGNIEMFCLTTINIHQGKSEFGVVTSAKMQEFYSNLMTDFSRMELAAMILKKIDAVSNDSDPAILFDLIKQTFSELNEKTNQELIETWFWFNYAKAVGEDVNLYRDTDGEKLSEENKYLWDPIDAALRKNPNGNIGVNEIKIMRLILTSKLSLVKNINNVRNFIDPILFIAKSINKL